MYYILRMHLRIRWVDISWCSDASERAQFHNGLDETKEEMKMLHRCRILRSSRFSESGFRLSSHRRDRAISAIASKDSDMDIRVQAKVLREGSEHLNLWNRPFVMHGLRHCAVEKKLILFLLAPFTLRTTIPHLSSISAKFNCGIFESPWILPDGLD